MLVDSLLGLRALTVRTLFLPRVHPISMVPLSSAVAPQPTASQISREPVAEAVCPASGAKASEGRMCPVGGHMSAAGQTEARKVPTAVLEPRLEPLWVREGLVFILQTGFILTTPSIPVLMCLFTTRSSPSNTVGKRPALQSPSQTLGPSMGVRDPIHTIRLAGRERAPWRTGLELWRAACQCSGRTQGQKHGGRLSTRGIGESSLRFLLPLRITFRSVPSRSRSCSHPDRPLHPYSSGLGPPRHGNARPGQSPRRSGTSSRSPALWSVGVRYRYATGLRCCWCSDRVPRRVCCCCLMELYALQVIRLCQSQTRTQTTSLRNLIEVARPQPQPQPQDLVYVTYVRRVFEFISFHFVKRGSSQRKRQAREGGLRDMRFCILRTRSRIAHANASGMGEYRDKRSVRECSFYLEQGDGQDGGAAVECDSVV